MWPTQRENCQNKNRNHVTWSHNFNSPAPSSFFRCGCVPLSTIGMIWGKLICYQLSIIDYWPHTQHAEKTSHTSVCAKIHDKVNGYNTSSDFWLRCLYEGEQGDPADVEKGFLKSRLLVKVCISPIAPPHTILTYRADIQNYIHITILSGRWGRSARQLAQTPTVQTGWV